MSSPVYNVKAVPLDKIRANSYNPNAVAPPEMKLLELSIWEDGYTMPVVCYYLPDEDIYEIVDGYHRYTVLQTSERIREREKGKLPVVVIDKDVSNRMASTIRHNRARGSHSIELMSNIVVELTKAGMSDAWILRHIGMDKDELLRLKQVTGLAELFKDKEFTEAAVEECVGMESDRRHLCIGGDAKAGDVLQRQIGDIVGVVYFKPGARFAPAVIQKVGLRDAEKPEKLAFAKLVMYPSEGGSQLLTLHHTDTRTGGFGWDKVLTNDKRTGMDCLLWEMNEHELVTAKKRISSAIPKEEEQVMEVVLTTKEIAAKLLGVLSQNVGSPVSAEGLAAAAKIPYTDTIPMILQKLREAGRVKRLSDADGVKVWKLA